MSAAESAGGVPYPDVPPVTAADLPTAGPGSPARIGARAIARLLDYLLLTLIATLLFGAVLGIPGEGEMAPEVPVWLTLVLLLVQLLYEVLGVALSGRTLGKYLLGLKVVGYVGGGRPSFTAALARAVVPLAVVVVLGTIGSFIGFPPLGTLCQVGVYLSALASPVFRGVHDRASGTIVLVGEPPGFLQRRSRQA